MTTISLNYDSFHPRWCAMLLDDDESVLIQGFGTEPLTSVLDLAHSLGNEWASALDLLATRGLRSPQS